MIQALVVGEFEANCYIVSADSGGAVVIDPGAEPELILEALARARLEVAVYLLTHGHFDHVSGLAGLRAKFPAPVAISEADAAWVSDQTNCFPPLYPVPPTLGAEVKFLKDGQECAYGDLVWRVIATPGHTPGSLCFHVPAAGTVFTGDTLFAGTVGRTDLPGGDPMALAVSVRRLRKLAPATAIYPGHGPASTLEREIRVNPFMSA